MNKRRVVISGVGAITPLGLDVPTLWQNLLAGKSGITKITSFDTTSSDVKIGGEIKNFDPRKYSDEKEIKRSDRFAQLAVGASEEAIKDAKIDFNKCDRTRCGCIIASGIGGIREFEEQHSKFLERGPSRISPFFVPKLMGNAASALVSLRNGLKGANFSVVSACSSSNHAIGIALRLIQYGDADIIIAGGSEAILTCLCLSGFGNMRALSTRNDEPEKASRPFEKNRDGFVLSEGAGILVLEELGHAVSRGAKIYTEIVGFGMSDDAYHLTAPDETGEGPALAMSNAIKDAGLAPSEISYINAHGTSTPLNDVIETKAIKSIFGDEAKKIPISSTKSMTGHLIGAAGAVELIITALSIKNDIICPTINYEVPDPECDLDYTPNVARKVKVEYAISNSFGFGGHNSTIAISKYRER